MKNKKVVIYSLIALVCMYLTFAVDWMFIIPAVILSWQSQKELFHRE